jgi:hypothetical protein
LEEIEIEGARLLQRRLVVEQKAKRAQYAGAKRYDVFFLWPNANQLRRRQRHPKRYFRGILMRHLGGYGMVERGGCDRVCVRSDPIVVAEDVEEALQTERRMRAEEL